MERRELELTTIAESLARRREEMRRVEEALGTRERQLDRRAGDLERRAGEVKRREDEIDRAEEEVEQLRSTMLKAELPHDDGGADPVELDDDGSPVQAWLDRRRRKQASLEARQADLEKREDSMRELESRLRSLEGTLARKEADLTAFAEMLQQSLHTAEEAAIGEHRSKLPADEDPTQRLRFWTRDSAAGR
jgi:chromosome segregation ATPase